MQKDRRFIDPVYGYDLDFDGYALAGRLDDDVLAETQPLVARAISPADARTIASELARLRAMTKAKAETDTDLEMLAQVYCDEMRDYPPDVVRAACRGWGRREKWWPAWSELKAELDGHVRKRRALAKTLGVETR